MVLLKDNNRITIRPYVTYGIIIVTHIPHIFCPIKDYGLEPCENSVGKQMNLYGVARHNLNLTRFKCEGQVVFNYF